MEQCKAICLQTYSNREVAHTEQPFMKSKHSLQQHLPTEAIEFSLFFIKFLRWRKVINLLKPNGNYTPPPASTVNIYVFRMILSVNGDYFLKQH
jgi:hypothetical protein